MKPSLVSLPGGLGCGQMALNSAMSFRALARKTIGGRPGQDQDISWTRVGVGSSDLHVRFSSQMKGKKREKESSAGTVPAPLVSSPVL